MCCFAGPVLSVRNTSIFGRLTERGTQFLVYQMEFSSAGANAMILPLPTALPAREDAVRFLDLKGYGSFFADLQVGFPVRQPFQLSRSRSAAAGVAVAAAAPLEVHEVGDYVASFVPSQSDFGRLDPAFRISKETWAKIPTYGDYGFAVFQLKSHSGKPHPMAFEFDTRMPDAAFFPTVHIHDGEVHAVDAFDHALYVQDARFDRAAGSYDDHDTVDRATQLVRSDRAVGAFADAERAKGVLDPHLLVHRRDMRGTFPNRDVLLGLSQASIAPSAAARASSWGLRMGPAVVGISALAWVIARRNKLRGKRKA